MAGCMQYQRLDFILHHLFKELDHRLLDRGTGPFRHDLSTRGAAFVSVQLSLQPQFFANSKGNFCLADQ